MRICIPLLALFFSTAVSAAMRWHLVPCEHNRQEMCKIGSQGWAPVNSVCQLPDDTPEDTLGSEIKIEKVPVNPGTGKDPGLIDRALAFVGIKELQENEILVCTVDLEKRQARLDSERAAREAEEQAREAERLKRVEAKAALRAMKGKVKDLTKDEMAELLEKVIDLQAGE